jgi:hypothetical protein
MKRVLVVPWSIAAEYLAIFFSPLNYSELDFRMYRDGVERNTRSIINPRYGKADTRLWVR